jgi:hypothetical protein
LVSNVGPTEGRDFRSSDTFETRIFAMSNPAAMREVAAMIAVASSKNPDLE